VRHFRRRALTSPKRKISWASATVFDPIAMTGPSFDIFGVWLRAPGGSYDSFEDEDMASNDTLVRLLPSFHIQIRNDDDGISGAVQVYQGVIAWDSLYDDDTIPLEIPSPIDGEHQWVWRNMVGTMTAGEFAGIPAYTSFSDISREDVRAQRRFPQKRGLLYVCITKVLTPSQDITRWVHFDARFAVKRA